MFQPFANTHKVPIGSSSSTFPKVCLWWWWWWWWWCFFSFAASSFSCCFSISNFVNSSRCSDRSVFCDVECFSLYSAFKSTLVSFRFFFFFRLRTVPTGGKPIDEFPIKGLAKSFGNAMAFSALLRLNVSNSMFFRAASKCLSTLWRRRRILFRRFFPLAVVSVKFSAICTMLLFRE